jgi:hypothetical protein
MKKEQAKIKINIGGEKASIKFNLNDTEKVVEFAKKVADQIKQQILTDDDFRNKLKATAAQKKAKTHAQPDFVAPDVSNIIRRKESTHLKPEEEVALRKDRKKGTTVPELASKYKVSERTVYRVIKEEPAKEKTV